MKASAKKNKSLSGQGLPRQVKTILWPVLFFSALILFSSVAISPQKAQADISFIKTVNIFPTKLAAPVEQVAAKPISSQLKAKQDIATAQIKTGKYIDISLSRQRMVLFEDGKALNTYIVSSGKASMPTPVGTFAIQNKVSRAWSQEFGLWMPWWMAFLPSGAMGIHELPEWPSGYKEGAAHLGTPVSHGCVRLGVGPAKRVYDWADIGTPVVIHR